jgi:hypothetical protein
MMNALPDFVTEGDEEGRSARSSHVVLLTGWETVVFQLDDEEPGSDSTFSTAALAP